MERFALEYLKWIGFAFNMVLYFSTKLGDWLINFPPLGHPIRRRTTTNRDSHTHDLPRFPMHLLWVLIGSLDCLCNLWLVSAMTSVLVLRKLDSGEWRKSSPGCTGETWLKTAPKRVQKQNNAIQGHSLSWNALWYLTTFGCLSWKERKFKYTASAKEKAVGGKHEL